MRLILASLVAFSMPLPLLAQDSANTTTIAFDWFTYTGNDHVFADELPAGSYRNPILTGFYPDPSICRVGEEYYLINSTFAYFPGIPIFQSKDLVNWKQIGHVINRAGQLNYDGLGVSRGIFAPAISHHDDRFYVACTHVDAGGNFFVTATNPAGPWSDPVWLDFEGIDPSFFFDTDGRAWVVNNGGPEGKPLYEGHRAIWIQEFDVKAQKLIGPRSVLVNGGVDLSKKPICIEGPHLFKRGGWYYLCCAEGGTGDDHSQVIFRSKEVTGPFIPWERNPILTQRDLPGDRPSPVTCAGHADLVCTSEGSWWAVFLGCRPYHDRYYTTGRETFLLPVTWNDEDWPVILPSGRTIPFILPGPKNLVSVAQKDRLNPPLSGNVSWRDDFDDSALALSWFMLRQPHETWWSLTKPSGSLSLLARRDRLDGRGNPSFVARRVQHARFDATTMLAIPQQNGVSAGLVLFQNETHHYYFGVSRRDEGLVLFIERFNGKGPEILARRDLPTTSQIAIKIVARDSLCSFAYASETGAWATLLSDADATLLTTQAAGGFVGAVIGLHARTEQ